MKSDRRSFLARAVGAATLALGLVVVALIAAGPMYMTGDSFDYFEVAQSVAAGHGLVNQNGTPFVIQPPLYPLLLALVSQSLRIEIVHAAHALNVLIFGLTILGTARLAGRYAPETAVPAALLAIFSVPLLFVSQMAWTEPLFILLSVWFFHCLERYRQHTDWPAVMALALAAALASLTRYLGVTLIATGAIFIVCVTPDLRKRVALSLGFVVSACAPLSIWLAHNYLVSGTLVGLREPSTFTLLENMQATAVFVESWFRPLLLPAGILIALTFTRINWRLHFATLFAPLLFMAFYLVALIASSTTTHYDPIGHRLLSPVFVPAAASLLVTAAVCLRAVERSRSLNAALVMAGAALLITLAALSVNTISPEWPL